MLPPAAGKRASRLAKRSTGTISTIFSFVSRSAEIGHRRGIGGIGVLRSVFALTRAVSRRACAFGVASSRMTHAGKSRVPFAR